ncbi:MAG: hypothetical protein GMKNLPBB_02410 [Myxococcota bacterium]|nr:hypothetical protein [Myxococcota bacterium]
MLISKDPLTYTMQVSADCPFPTSKALFEFAVKVHAHRIGLASERDVNIMEIYRGAGYSGSFSRFWRQGKENFNSIVKLFQLSEFLGVDPMILIDILRGDLTVDKAFKLVSDPKKKDYRKERGLIDVNTRKVVVNFSDRLRLKILKILQEGHLDEGDYFDTREVAELFKVSQRTVQWWIDTKKLTCAKTSGGHSRVRYEDIIKFVEERGVYNPLTMFVNRKLLVIDSKANYAKYEQRLQSHKALDLFHAESLDDALLAAGKLQPDFVLISDGVDGVDFKRLADVLEKNVSTLDSLMAVGKFQGGEVEKLKEAGYDYVYTRPLKYEQLLEDLITVDKNMLSRPRRVRRPLW